MATPSGGAHRCPDCGAGYAERRSPRSPTERLRVALSGRRPYRCLQCGRRFYDRPTRPVGQRTEAATTSAVAAETSLPRRRQAYWRVDVAAAGLRPTEITLVGLFVLIVAAVTASVLLLLWPESVSVVHQAD